ncbi:MAG: cobyrinate a,c-diamide synthase [Synergistaceae bacterium]|nr:cobyrinate a,c-diamide synthase [Synergistaceae bacterium]
MASFSDTKGFILAAAASGAGKTTVASAICRTLREMGLEVQPFKTGPDFVDPTYLSHAAGRRCRSLDGFPNPGLMPFFYSEGCSARKNLPNADIAVIEGVMGMYDGLDAAGLYSSAWLAHTLGLPVVLLVDAKSSAASVAAVVKGFATLEPLAPRVVGVIANRVSGEGHAETIRETLLRFVGIPLIGWLHDLKDTAFPSRHLGLIPAGERRKEQERQDTEETLLRFVCEIRAHVDIRGLINMADVPSGVWREPELPEPVKKADGSAVSVAVAADDAFCFHYHENWELLERLGAELIQTRPMTDRSVPGGADALILPGGYPEEFARELAGNREYLASVREFAGRGVTYAECGGMMYLARGVEFGGVRSEMAGVIEAEAQMTGKLHRFGYVEGTALKDNILFKEGETVKAHEFHYSSMEGAPPEAFSVRRALRGGEWIDGYAIADRLLATYLHINFYSCPRSAGRFLTKAAAAKA